jgi:hypothetical protein
MTMSETELDLEKLRAVAEAATPGKRQYHQGTMYAYNNSGGTVLFVVDGFQDYPRQEDVDLMAEMDQGTVHSLLALAERGQRAEKLEAALTWASGMLATLDEFIETSLEYLPAEGRQVGNNARKEIAGGMADYGLSEIANAALAAAPGEEP